LISAAAVHEVFDALFNISPIVGVGYQIIVFSGVFENKPFENNAVSPPRRKQIPVVTSSKIGSDTVKRAPIKIGIVVLPVAKRPWHRDYALIFVVAKGYEDMNSPGVVFSKHGERENKAKHGREQCIHERFPLFNRGIYNVLRLSVITIIYYPPKPNRKNSGFGDKYKINLDFGIAQLSS
jgi:hypothetical protein